MLFGDDTRNGRPGKHNAERSFLTNNAENNMDAQTPDCKNGSKLCCSDAFPHCEILGKSYCAEIYMQPDSWYFENCRKYCGWCGIDPKEFQQTSTTTQTPTTSDGRITDCKNGSKVCCYDVFPHCKNLGRFYCSDIYMQPESYTFKNCRKYCGWCGIYPKEFQQTSTTTQPYNPNRISQMTSTTVQQELCQYKGKLYKQGDVWQDGCQYNCSCVNATLGYYICRSLCPSYVGLPHACLVTVAGQCCPRLDCVAPTEPEHHLVLYNYCYYKGHHYRQNDRWQDGCDASCTCTNAHRGYYSCGSVCLNWDSLPKICQLDPALPGHCCKQPTCPANIIINVPKAYKQQYPRSPSHNYAYV